MLARPEFFFIWSLIEIFQKIDFFGQIKTEGLWCHQHANGNPLQRSNMIFSSCSPSSREAPHLPSCPCGHPQVLLPPFPEVWLLPQMKDWTGLQPRGVKSAKEQLKQAYLVVRVAMKPLESFILIMQHFITAYLPKASQDTKNDVGEAWIFLYMIPYWNLSKNWFFWPNQDWGALVSSTCKWEPPTTQQHDIF